MKAVNKFKKVVAEKRPPIMASILGDDESSRFSQPPLAMQRDAKARPPTQKSQSLDTFDRRGIEGALAVEGVHREMDVVQSPTDMSLEVCEPCQQHVQFQYVEESKATDGGLSCVVRLD